MTDTKAITRIQVQGFRSLKDVDLPLGRVNVLIGSNCSGKSNLLSVLRMVPHIGTHSLRRFVGETGGASALLHYGPATTTELSLRLEFQEDSESDAYAATLGHSVGDTFRFLKETVEHRPGDVSGFTTVADFDVGYSESRLSEEPQSLMAPRLTTFIKPAVVPGADSLPVQTVRSWLSQIRFYHFHDASSSSPLRQNSPHTNNPDLRSDGGNLAAVLHQLANSAAADEIASWKRIEHSFRRISPNVKRLQPTLVDPANPTTSAFCLRWVDDRDHIFGVEDLSGGAIRALALITTLSQPVSRLPGVLCIDEPELGLHPAALTLLAGLVRSVAPRCQMILATQSPAFLDEFSAGEVVVAERREGATNLHRLDPDHLKGWLENYSLSELYEKNVLGGRP